MFFFFSFFKWVLLKCAFLWISGARKAINSELWHACAGPLVSLPHVGSLVYYFPQGHSEQVPIVALMIIQERGFLDGFIIIIFFFLRTGGGFYQENSNLTDSKLS